MGVDLWAIGSVGVPALQRVRNRCNDLLQEELHRGRSAPGPSNAVRGKWADVTLAILFRRGALITVLGGVGWAPPTEPGRGRWAVPTLRRHTFTCR